MYVLFSFISVLVLSIGTQETEILKYWHKKGDKFLEYHSELDGGVLIKSSLMKEYEIGKDSRAFLHDDNWVYYKPDQIVKLKNEEFTLEEFLTKLFKSDLDISRGHNYKVFVALIISDTGEVINKGFQRNSGCISCDQEALNAISNFEWQPAKVGDKPIASFFVVPFVFKNKLAEKNGGN